MPWGTDGLYVESNPGARTWGGIMGVLGAGLQGYKEASDKRRGEEREDAKETRQDARLDRTEQKAWEREMWRHGRTDVQNQIALALQMGSPEMFEAAYRQAYPENGVASAWRQTFGGGDYFKRLQEDRAWDLAEKKRVADMATRTMTLQEAKETRDLTQQNQLAAYQQAQLAALEAARKATSDRPTQVGNALVTSAGKALYTEPEKPTVVFNAKTGRWETIKGKYGGTINEPIMGYRPDGTWGIIGYGDTARGTGGKPPPPNPVLAIAEALGGGAARKPVAPPVAPPAPSINPQDRSAAARAVRTAKDIQEEQQHKTLEKRRKTAAARNWEKR